MRPNICRRWSLAAGTEHIPATRKRCWRVSAPTACGSSRSAALRVAARLSLATTTSVPGGQAISTIYWYEQLGRYSVQRSVAAFALVVSTLVGIATLVLLTAGGLAPPEKPVGANHLVLLLVLGLLNWLFDAAVLFAALAAMGQAIPWASQ
jgi:hypothetical protein